MPSAETGPAETGQAGSGLLLCVDFGSTFTKVALVDADGTLVGSAAAPTTIDSDLMDGFGQAVARLGDPRAETAEVAACSSAGGGLRITVVGNEALVSAEAGRRVALSSGGKVVDVIALAGVDGVARGADPDVTTAEPDVVLLVGGTDGGNGDSLVAGARLIAGTGLPVVIAGNIDAQEAAAAALTGHEVVRADNVVPRIGVLAPDSARRAIRELFIEHVIGGKQLSSDPAFRAMIRGATPDLALTGAETIAATTGLDVVVLDIGGATTDVHSVVTLDPEEASLAREVVAVTGVTRTVEGDLGMRWSAVTAVQEAVAGGWEQDTPELREAAQRRRDEPAYLGEDGADPVIAGIAAAVGMRRHCGRSRVVVGPDGRVVERTGKDLRQVDLLIGSGGVFRHAAPEQRTAILDRASGIDPEGWQLPEHPRTVVDQHAVLAAVGLLSAAHPEAAARLARSLVP